ncbi:MAG: 4Fe-4S binding protein [Chitinispirillales bacterium]|jgi:sulfate adenylyltransferase subunit 1|nr:4Fe-4S binding protein [Chitinispirillales bacterium]
MNNAELGLLKFITCGSVDDGKSTLIGRLLYDSKLIYADQERALILDSRVGSRGGKLDYSLLLDGLMAEREQGITIDVAYRYFTTGKRSFIVADTPGHEEYTRNMAVGASFADLAVLLVDAALGVLPQTIRHARICALMGIRYFVFAVNKMDLAGYSQERFKVISREIEKLLDELKLDNTVIIPVSATEGDNITERGGNMPWYDGSVLLSYLESVDTGGGEPEAGFYMPVQRVCRPDRTFRGFQGQVESGTVSVGDTLTALPSGETAVVETIYVADKQANSAAVGQSVTLQLDREVDVSRGCVLTRNAGLKTVKEFEAALLWMDSQKLVVGKEYWIKIGTKLSPAVVTGIRHKVDVNTGALIPVDAAVKNEIVRCEIAVTEHIVLDEFRLHKTLGELILIDRVSHSTAACGTVEAVGKQPADAVLSRGGSSLGQAKNTAVDYKALKNGGFMRQVRKNNFSLRLKVVGGNLTAEQLQTIAEISKKYGDGYVHLTSRQGVEIPFIKLAENEEVKAELKAGGVDTGVCGPRVRTVTACQGCEICPSGCIDTYPLAVEISERYFGRELPHKFKFGVTGCANNCLKAEENDIGVKGGYVIEWQKEACDFCGVCVKVCREGAITRSDANGINEISLDKSKCDNCGRCVKSCPVDAWRGDPGYILSFGGTFGNLIAKGEQILPIIMNRETLFRVADAALDFFDKHAKKSERFRIAIDRTGWDKFKTEMEAAYNE